MGNKRIDRDLVARAYAKHGSIIRTAIELGIHRKTVGYILKELRVPVTNKNRGNRKYNVDESFFEAIDSHEKAYILGFIFGDGNLRPGYLRIELGRKDESILESIRKAMRSEHPIYRRERFRKDNKNESSILVISRKKMVLDLMQYGLQYNNKNELKFPKIDSKYYCSFILGLSDSDGHIGIDHENRVVWSLIASVDINIQIQRTLSFLGIKAALKYDRNYSYELTRLFLHNKSQVIKLRDYLYNNSTIYLDRKFNTFNKVRYKDPRKFGKHNPFFGKSHSEKTKRALSLANRGENCWSSKLKEDDVIFIKKHPNLKTKDVSKMFNISPGTVRSIRRGDTWSHVKIKED